MSHGVVLVILGKKEFPEIDLKRLQELIKWRMQPYDENLQVEEYDRECFCKKWDARRKAEEWMQDKYQKTFADLRNEFQATRPKIKNSRNLSDDELMKEFEEEQKEWEKFTGWWIREQDQKQKEFLETQQPDPKCEECEGTGFYESTYNPKSKWDWYEIGGRWRGSLIIKKGKEAILTADVAPFNTSIFKLVSSSSFEEAGTKGYEGNAFDGARIEDIDWETEEMKQFSTLAVITKDKKWRERAELGWWGTTHETKDGCNIEDTKEIWQEKFHERFISKLDPKDFLVIIDYHI